MKKEAGFPFIGWSMIYIKVEKLTAKYVKIERGMSSLLLKYGFERPAIVLNDR